MRAFVWPAGQPPNNELPNLAASLGKRVRVRRFADGMRLEVDRLPFGFKIGIGWSIRRGA